ncbi:MAG: FAD-dependent oxidoreductase [Acidobacteriia bacterium]|nr:FAD-dependent oxidoreductase [Terriglobia bacterium]
MTTAGFDVAIVGAGVVGAACALECARAGLRVIVLDRDPIGGGTTGAGMGHLVVMDDSEAQFALTRFSCSLWNERGVELPPEVEYQKCGTIWVAADEVEMAEVHRKQDFYSSRGVAVEVLDYRQLAEAEPNLREGLVGGLLVRDDSVLYPPCATRFLIEKAQQQGAVLRLNSTVASLGSHGPVLSDGSVVSAGITVNAAGISSPQLVAGIEVQPRKGHLLITDRYPGFLNHQVVELGYLKRAHSVTSDSVAFNVQPRKNGQILIGSSRQYGNREKGIDALLLRQMIRQATEYMPELKNLSTIRAWTGFRPATRDNLPFIGPHPNNENICLATGHEGLGITTSLATAELLVDQLLKRPSKIPYEPYLPGRSGERRADA